MWNKIYLIALAILILPIAFFYSYSWLWLKSIGSPINAVTGFEYHSSLAWSFLWISTVILLILANIILWKIRKSWAIWATFGYFTISILAKYFWLEPALKTFKHVNNLAETGISIQTFTPVFAVFLCLIAAVIVYFNQFLVLRLNNKMYPQNVSNEEIVIETENELVN